MDFWSKLAAMLGASVIVIDRPKGCPHPRFPAMAYPLDYGYLAGTSGDGNEIDIFRGSREAGQLDAIACTADTLKRDTEIKLLLGCTNEEIETVRAFLNNSDHMSAIVLRRPDSDDGAAG